MYVTNKLLPRQTKYDISYIVLYNLFVAVFRKSQGKGTNVMLLHCMCSSAVKFIEYDLSIAVPNHMHGGKTIQYKLTQNMKVCLQLRFIVSCFHLYKTINSKL